jgi:hypothetical protein
MLTVNVRLAKINPVFRVGRRRETERQGNCKNRNQNLLHV